MLCAKLLRPPVHGATLKSVDASPATAVEGVRVVQEGDLLAVLHEHPDVAEERSRACAPIRRADGSRRQRHDLRPSARKCAGGENAGQRRRPSERREARLAACGSDLLQQLRAHVRTRAARSRGQNRGRQGNRLGLDAESIYGPRRGGPSDRLPERKRPDHNAVPRRRFWRQNVQQAGSRGGAAGEGRRTTGAGGLEPCRRVLLRHLPTRRDREDPRGGRPGGPNRALGLSGLLRRRSRSEAVLPRAQPSHRGSRRRLAIGAGHASLRNRRVAQGPARTRIPTPANRIST